MKLKLSGIVNGPWRIRTVLIWVMLACLGPGMVGLSIQFVQEYQLRRSQLEQDTLATARALVQSVDSRLAIALTAVQAFASRGAPALAELPRFHRLARKEIQATGAGMNFVLSDPSGKQLVNTLREFGEPLPRHGNPKNLERLFATGRPVISGLYIGGVLSKPVLSVEVPVTDKNGKIVYGLAIGLLPSDFSKILLAQKLPEGWFAVIFDNTGTIVARTPGQETWVGQKGTAEYIEKIMQSPEGVMSTVTREGIPTVSVWSRSAYTGWSVGIGIPRQLLNRDLNKTMGYLAAWIALVLVLSLGLAARVSRNIATSIKALTGPAKAMAEEGKVVIPQLNILEPAEIAEEIRIANELLRSRADALLEANRELERLAHVDPITGLQNRLSMNEAINMEFMRYKRTQNPYAVLFFDFDYFKRINDSYGHEKGDQVLFDAAEQIKMSLRGTDFVARYGGEEFLALLPDTGIDEALAVAEKIRRRIAEHEFSIPQTVTLSIGIAVVLAEDQHPDEAVRRADKALYAAKEAGRNTVCLFQSLGASTA